MSTVPLRRDGAGNVEVDGHIPTPAEVLKAPSERGRPGRRRFDEPSRPRRVASALRTAPRRFGVVLLILDTCALLAGFGTAGPHTMVAGTLLAVVILAWRGMYRSRLTVSVLDALPALLLAPLVAGSLAVTHDILRPEPGGFHYGHTASSGLLAGALLVLTRAVAYAVVRYGRTRGWASYTTLILGAGHIGRELGETLQTHPQYGLRPAAFWDPAPFLDETALGLPVLNDVPLADAIAQTGASVVLIAFGRSAESDMVDMVRTCDRMDTEIFVVPRLFELSQRSSGMDEIWGTPLVRLRRPAFRSKTWHLKRLVDVLVSTLLLIPLLPVLALCALAVRVEGGKGVIFRQERVGLDGRVFELLKFRSMRPLDDAESATRWNVARDSRLGPVGRFLRRSSLDELPQLVNVLRGDMTLVGPRPERPYFVAQFSGELPRYLARHRVPAGLTGWAQIHGLRGDTSMRERIRFDNYYIENWSLWLDFRILARTVTAVVRREGA